MITYMQLPTTGGGVLHFDYPPWRVQIDEDEALDLLEQLLVAAERWELPHADLVMNIGEGDPRRVRIAHG